MLEYLESFVCSLELKLWDFSTSTHVRIEDAHMCFGKLEQQSHKLSHTRHSNDNMLSGQCGDDPGISFICTGVTGWDGHGPI